MCVQFIVCIYRPNTLSSWRAWHTLDTVQQQSIVEVFLWRWRGPINAPFVSIVVDLVRREGLDANPDQRHTAGYVMPKNKDGE